MIYFFVTKAHDYTIKSYIKHWETDLKKEIKLIHYEGLANLRKLDTGTFIFSDIERLTASQASIVNGICQQIRMFSKDSKILNQPRSVLKRFPMLKKLHERGINRYNVFPVPEIPDNLKYPVFLRRSNDHHGPRTSLIKDRDSLKRIILQAAISGINLSEIAQIEFCETICPDRYYRRYTAFRISDRIIPGQILFSRDWQTKPGEPDNSDHLQEVKAYQKNNPHEERLREIFDLAGIQYGRIDYSLLDGNPQVWQITTNPVLISSPPEQYKPENLPIKQRLSDNLSSGFASLSKVTANNVNDEIPVWLDLNMLKA